MSEPENGYYPSSLRFKRTSKFAGVAEGHSTESLMTFDPEEIVTLYGQGQMTLRTAVERVMTRDPMKQSAATIFREGEPSILDLAQIEKIAAEWGMAP